MALVHLFQKGTNNDLIKRHFDRRIPLNYAFLQEYHSALKHVQ